MTQPLNQASLCQLDCASLTIHKATLDDLKAIIALLQEDELGKNREYVGSEVDARYIDAFHKIDGDAHHYLMVVKQAGLIVATCHLTILPSLTFTGSTRMQIEAVRVAARCRGQKIGTWMMQAAMAYGKSQGALIVQLTTNKARSKARDFYEKLGFQSTHEGMKLYL